MNTAWKVIVSFWVPFLVIFPASLIEVKTNVQRFGDGTTWTTGHLYELLWFWYLCGIIAGVFLLYLWRTSNAMELPDETQN